MGLRSGFWIIFGVCGLGAASLAYAQVDPFAAARPPAPRSSTTAPGASVSPSAILTAPPAPSRPAGRVGFTGVEQAVGRSYAGAQTTGFASMAQISMLPKSVPPLSVRLKVNNPRNLKARPRIVIPSYALGVVRRGDVRASAAGQGSEIAQRATSISTVLIGVSDDLATALANEAAQDLFDRLKAEGIDVVSPEELASSRDIGRVKITEQRVKGLNGWSVYGAQSAPLRTGHPLAPAGIYAGAAIALTDVAYDLDAIVLQPYLAVDYEQIGGSGSKMYSGSASASAHLKFRIASGGANFLYGQARGKGSGPGGSLQAEPVGTDEPFGVMFDIDDKSDDPVIHNAFASLGMGSLYRQSKYYGVEAAPERYAALVRAAYQGLNTAIIAEIKKARG